MTILLQLRFRISPGNAESYPQTELSSRPEESWPCGPPKGMKNASVQPSLSMEPPLFPVSSRAKPRDLQFYGPVVEMFSTERTRISYHAELATSTMRLSVAKGV